MRVFLTGLTGFTGRVLGGQLRAAGHEVAGLTRIGGAAGPEGVRAYRGDLRVPEETEAAVADFQPELVMHLAAFPAPSRSAERPLDVVDDSIRGTVVLFEALKTMARRPAVLLAGSATAYGRVAAVALPITEDHPLRPLSPYGVAKAAQELYAWQYRETDGFRVFVTRTFNSTGPGQGEDFFLPRLCAEVARRERGSGAGEPIRTGALDVQRDFLDVRDVARAYALLAATPAAEGKPVNVCSGTPVRLADVAELLRGLARVPVTFVPDAGRVPVSQDAVVYGSPARLHALTGFAPAFPLARTVADVLEDARRRIGSDRPA